MDLKTTIELRSVQAAGKQDRFQPVHAGAHNRFTKAGYMHTGNKNRGGIATSEYFKTKGGNSRTVSVQADGSYVKTSRTIKGNKRSRGKFDAKGMKCGTSVRADWAKWNEEHPYQSTGKYSKATTDAQHKDAAGFHSEAAEYHKTMASKFGRAADDARATGNYKDAKTADAESALHTAAAAAHSAAAAYHAQNAEDGETSSRTGQLSKTAGELSSKATNLDYGE